MLERKKELKLKQGVEVSSKNDLYECQIIEMRAVLTIGRKIFWISGRNKVNE